MWQALLDQPRWTYCLPENAPTRIEQLEVVDETFERVGDRRRCAAVLDGLPLIGRRRLTWDEQVTDVDHERTLEVEALPSRHAIRRWRVRFWLVGHEDGGTRVRCHVSYRPVSVRGWLADRLVLRRRVEAAAQSWLEGLAASFEPERLDERRVPEVSEALVAA